MQGVSVSQVVRRLVAGVICVFLMTGQMWGLPLHDQQSLQHQQQQQQQETHRRLQRGTDGNKWPALCTKICRSWDSICLNDCAQLMPPNYTLGRKRSALPFDDKLGNLSFDDYMFLKMVGRL